MVKVIVGLLFAAQALAAPLMTEKQLALSPGQNIMVNPGFEVGLGSWTSSGGTFTQTTTSADVGKGRIAGSWDSSSAAQTLTSSAFTIPSGLYGRNVVASCLIKGSGATHKIQAWNGSSVIGEQTIISNSTYSRSTVSFTMPSSGTMAIRLASVASNEPAIFIDDCVLGDITQPVQSQAIYWSGSHGSDCSFSKSGASFGDFGNDASCTFTEAQNQGFGTVTTYGSTKPGVTWTPTQTGRYLVVANIGSAGDVNNEVYSYQLKTGATIISNQDMTTKGSAGAAYVVSTTLSGILNISSLSSVTAHIEGYAGSGSVYINGNGAGGNAVEWTIISLEQTFPSVGYVSSNSAGVERIERALATSSSSPAIESQSGTWITGSAGNGTGSTIWTITGFSAKPACTCTPEDANRRCSVNVSSSTEFTTYRYNGTETAENGAVSLICMGPK